MLAVSVQPTPLRWIVKVVPTGPRLTSSGSTVGVIQYLPVFFADPVSIHRPCAPPRSSGTSKDRKSTRLNSSHSSISYAVFCLKKKNTNDIDRAKFLKKAQKYGLAEVVVAL